MRGKDKVIHELTYSASGRFSACETQQDFEAQTRLYAELLTEQIDRLITVAVEAERARCARIASHVFINDPYALHPDIAFDDLNESARTAAHSIAQTIAGLILGG